MAVEVMTEKDKQILEHLEQAQRLDVPLTEYCSAYGVELKDLYTGKAALVRKGILPAKPATPTEPSAFVAVRVAPGARKAADCVFRLTHPSGWILECGQIPDATWMLTVLSGVPHAAH
jgi:hypothetical protein